MALTLNDVWNQFNDLIGSQGAPDSNLAKKLRAVNDGSQYLVQFMVQKNKGPSDLLSDSTDVATVASQNYVDLPSDFLRLDSLHQLVGSEYLEFSHKALVDFDTLKKGLGPLFFDTTDTGTPSLFAIKGERLYFNKHITATDADGMRIFYYKIPATVTAYNTLTLTSVVGTFQADEEITVTGDSTPNADIVTINSASSIDISTSSMSDLQFAVGEAITGGTSGATAVIDTISVKPLSLDFSKRFQIILPQAWATMFFVQDRSMEREEADLTLENLIDLYFDTENQGHFTWGGVQL